MRVIITTIIFIMDLIVISLVKQDQETATNKNLFVKIDLYANCVYL